VSAGLGLPALSKLQYAAIQLPPGDARELEVWAHRVTSDGASEPLPALVEVRDADRTSRFDLKLSGGQTVLPVTGGRLLDPHRPPGSRDSAGRRCPRPSRARQVRDGGRSRPPRRARASRPGGRRRRRSSRPRGAGSPSSAADPMIDPPLHLHRPACGTCLVGLRRRLVSHNARDRDLDPDARYAQGVIPRARRAVALLRCRSSLGDQPRCAASSERERARMAGRTPLAPPQARQNARRR
jgi:hypothetical protein